MAEDYNIDATSLKDQFGLRGMNSADRDYFARVRSVALDPLMERNMKLRDQFMQEQAHNLTLATNMFNLKNAVDAKKKEREYDTRADELTDPLATIRSGGHKPKEALAKLDELELKHSDIFRNSPKARDILAAHRNLFTNRMQRNKEEATKNKEQRNKITSKYLTSAETIFSQEQADKLIDLYKRERGITEENPADLDDELVIQQINNLWMGKAKTEAEKARKDLYNRALDVNQAEAKSQLNTLAQLEADDDDLDKAISDRASALETLARSFDQDAKDKARALMERADQYIKGVGLQYGMKEGEDFNPYAVKDRIKERSREINKSLREFEAEGILIRKGQYNPEATLDIPIEKRSSNGVGSGFQGFIPTK